MEERNGLGDGYNSRVALFCMTQQFFLKLELKEGSNFGELEVSVQAQY